MYVHIYIYIYICMYIYIYMYIYLHFYIIYIDRVHGGREEEGLGGVPGAREARQEVVAPPCRHLPGKGLKVRERAQNDLGKGIKMR